MFSHGVHMVGLQLMLLQRQDTPAVDASFAHARRLVLDACSWVDVVPGWVRGHDVLFGALLEGVSWRQERRQMYDRIVDVPRLIGSEVTSPRVRRWMDEASQALEDRYGATLDCVSFAHYRHGNDSVAWHGDRPYRWWPCSVLAVASLGGRRRFLLRPRGGGRSEVIHVGEGDLVVMGGAVQRRWEHAVPKTRVAAPRIAVMFRHSKPLSTG